MIIERIEKYSDGQIMELYMFDQFFTGFASKIHLPNYDNNVTGPFCWEFIGHQYIPLTKASDMELDVFFDLYLNQQLRHRSFETPSPSLWRHCNVLI